MSNERAGDDPIGNRKDTAVSKTAGFVVFSGIAMSILKALNSLNKPKLESNHDSNEAKPITESTQMVQPHLSFSHQEPSKKKPIVAVEQKVPESSLWTIEIVKGDTLWGLSRKYGVSIEEIKEANGLTGDTIYTGKKLVIP